MLCSWQGLCWVGVLLFLSFVSSVRLLRQFSTVFVSSWTCLTWIVRCGLVVLDVVSLVALRTVVSGVCNLGFNAVIRPLWVGADGVCVLFLVLFFESCGLWCCICCVAMAVLGLWCELVRVRVRMTVLVSGYSVDGC